jgi:predicted nucleotidyltransferase
MSSKDVKKILKEELPNLAVNYGVKKIGLFGSFAKGKQSAGSDIDIVVEFSRPIGFRFIELCDYLENKLGKKVDVLTPAGIKSIRLKHVADDIKRNIIYV